ncbi:hypothetical protein D1007_38021 [Hordeum vulgare]|nr:hypothetical protein D1007_38021 [Hordeum vulgare]
MRWRKRCRAWRRWWRWSSSCCSRSTAPTSRTCTRRATSLSDAEKLCLRQIDEFAAAATIADYKASVGPVPAFDKHLSLFSQDIPLEFPEPLAPPPPSSASRHG